MKLLPYKKRPLHDDNNSFKFSIKKLKVEKPLEKELPLVEKSVEKIKWKSQVEEKRVQKSLKRDINKCPKDLAHEKVYIRRVKNNEGRNEIESKPMEFRGVRDTKELESVWEMLISQRAQLKEFESKEKQFERQLKELERKEKDYQERVKELDSKENQLEDQLKEYESREEKFQGQVKKLKSKKRDFDSHEKKFILKEKQFEENVRVLDLKEKQLEGQLKEFESKEKIFEGQVKEHQLKIKQLEENMRVFDLKKKQLEGWFTEFESKEKIFEGQVKEYQLKVKSFEEQVKDYESKEKQLEGQLKDFKSKKQEFEGQMKKFKTKKRHLKSRVKKHKSKEKQHEYRLKEFESEKEKFEECVMVVDSEVKELKLKLMQFERLVENLRLKEKHFERSKELETNQMIFNRQLKDVESREKHNEVLMITFGEEKESDENEFNGNDILFNLQESTNPSKDVLNIILNPIIPRSRNRDGTVIIDGNDIILLELLMKISPSVEPCVREEAKKLAIDLKANMSENAENSLVVLAFLLIVSIYGLLPFFDKDEVYKFLRFSAHHKIAVELFWTLGFADKISDFVQN